MALPLALLLAVSACGLAPAPASAHPKDAQAAEPDEPALRGRTCLFAGHSFFAPVARAFDALARRNGVEEHRAVTVFSPGRGGTPRGLWSDGDTRRRIEAELRTGDVEVFGLPIAFGRRSAEADYRRWIDLALACRSDVTIFLAQPWAPGGPRKSVPSYAAETERATARARALVESLKGRYPDARFVFVDDGALVASMKQRFEAASLPEVRAEVGRGDRTLFRDRLLGHASPLVHELAAAAWLVALYGADLDSLALSRPDVDPAAIVGPLFHARGTSRAQPDGPPPDEQGGHRTK
ncbi:MAG: hypothetical protein AAFU73_19850 [Planctomycetota bacterium]